MAAFFTTPDFLESLDRLDSSDRLRVREKLSFLSIQKAPLIFAKKLRGYKDIFRFRVGDFRVVFRLEKAAIVLLLVKHRKEIYEGL